MRTYLLPLLFALGTAGTACAEPFIAGSFGRSSWDLNCAGLESCDGHGTSGTLRAGYQFAPWLGVEARYFDLGKFGFERVVGTNFPELTPIIGSARYEVRGAGVGAIVSWPVSERFTLSGTVGVARVRTAVVGSVHESIFPDEEFRNWETKPYFGVSAAFNVTSAVAISLEADRYRARALDTVVIDNIGIGLTYRFR